MTKILLLLFFAFSISLGGCSTQTNNQDKSKFEDDKTKSSEIGQNIGTTLGLFDDETAVNQLNNTFALKNMRSFSPQIYINNRDVKENTFRLFFVLDYQQSNVGYDNQNVNYIDVSLKANEEKKLEIKLNDLSEGLHDFIIFCIRKPDDLLTEPKFFPPGHFNIIKRSILKVGEGKSKQIDYKSLNVKPSNDEIPLFVSKQPRNIVQGEFATLVSKKDIDDLWINFSTKRNSKYAVLTFSDKSLVKTDFYKIEEQGVVNIPFDSKIKDNSNVLVAVVENPFVMIKDDNSSNASWIVQTTNRISIVN
ncbi:hypothetical protein I6G76_01780 (plasmid) [Bacillus cereus]|uniref:Lipoprotein n=1 Tax=Bacillus cereus (strain ZK / E33L) TaxID=288681 RepID=Q4V249_BACCZ|nr:hypothetical protein [Bacillus cereus]AAY60208.1 hypothetical protein pE33L466_0039 [Bacillus cereus E33L]AJI26156.1 hypothetical protein BF28_5756 [Bacillus cereus E33L]QQA19043.1 hypothetical protein I6G76_01780 [Bacillus cereus]